MVRLTSVGKGGNMDSEPRFKNKQVFKGVMQETKTFSKSIMSLMVLLYFVGALLGTILVVIAAIVDMGNKSSLDSSMFIAYATYLGGPTATAIGFYAWKSKAENVLKIGKSFQANSTEVLDTVARMEE